MNIVGFKRHFIFMACSIRAVIMLTTLSSGRKCWYIKRTAAKEYERLSVGFYLITLSYEKINGICVKL